MQRLQVSRCMQRLMCCMQRNHIHHCTMGIWCDWEAQGTRITQNLLHDNQRPAFAKQSEGRYDVSGSVCGSGTWTDTDRQQYSAV